jgi:pimeloyl-ACP methyl ester carboxylesterase
MMLNTAITALRLLHLVTAGPTAIRRRGNESLLPLCDEAPPASLFEPEGRPRRTLVLVHGVTNRAEHDPSLVHLARSLASLGYRCIVPALQHLARFRHDPDDIDTIADAISAGYRLDARGVALIAFSYGASYALSAVADPRVNRLCTGLVGFGAYLRLDEALEHQRQLLLRCPDPTQDTADVAYLRYTLLVCHRAELELSADAWHAIDTVLVDFTSPRPIEEKLAPLLRYARDVDYVDLIQRYQRRPLSERLSPVNSLPDVECPVGLLHDPYDRFVPAHHADRIRAILDERPGTPKTRILTTRMLSHVQVHPMRRLADLPPLIRLLDIVLADHWTVPSTPTAPAPATRVLRSK